MTGTPEEISFSVLGPLEVRIGDRAVPVPEGRARTLLGGLLLRAGEAVPTRTLVHWLWDGEPPNPSRAKATLQMVVTRLRRALGPANVVRTMPDGYVADIPEGSLDLYRYRALVEQGRYAEALGLWRGDPLGDIRSDTLHQDEVVPLVVHKLAVLERRIESDLRTGADHALVVELQALTRTHPLHEPFWALLVRVLHRTGRRADALAAYQEAANVLARELGAKPGPGLRSAQELVLREDAADTTVPVPRQLPAGPVHFVGRARELDRLTRLVDSRTESSGTVVISAINGVGGIGKTALALHWAHQHADRFPDGQLYANLRGFDPSASPVAVGAVRRAFLNALGVPAERGQQDPDAEAALYQDVFRRKQVLVVLDNARDVEHVRPLLPMASPSLILVTSRNRLGGLTSAAPIVLDPLQHEEAWSLLTRRLGEHRVDGERSAAAGLVDRCAGLPLALAVVAARAATDTVLKLDDLLGELSSESGRLGALDAGDAVGSVRAMFWSSYRNLPAAAARLFRLLSLHPGPDFGVAAAASLMAVPVEEAEGVLEALFDAHLLSRPRLDRFAFHDLVRDFAAERLAEVVETEREEAEARLLGHYVTSAVNAALAYNPHRTPIAVDQPPPGSVTLEFTHTTAGEWLIVEEAAILGLVGRSDAHTWRLAWALADFHERSGRWREMVDVHLVGIEAAQAVGDVEGQARMRQSLGGHQLRSREYEEAARQLKLALSLEVSAGNQRGEAFTCWGLAAVADEAGHRAESLEWARRSLALYTDIGDEAARVSVLSLIGANAIEVGDVESGLAAIREVIEIHESLDDYFGTGATYENIGLALLKTGNRASAAENLRRAVDVWLRRGDRYQTGRSLMMLGDVLAEGGDVVGARDRWTESAQIFDEVGHHDGELVRERLRRYSG
ncbi:AfsR/SARP family transcriptional regulator [Saccharothrix variisporea]|uniref:DNA-binding SARP family transcriptional activator n=1 Tax=Saccharothrix variisporea TaxID=543527 RepID=A0A495XI01_9PSEU|nr:BTAD domain-containing putative transcriptional regulator [Saccharothrix variisporea]RKT72153.1 DNA-binding SARP family transcriptional activator [Saccharothrix variisporea]